MSAHSTGGTAFAAFAAGLSGRSELHLGSAEEFDGRAGIRTCKFVWAFSLTLLLLGAVDARGGERVIRATDCSRASVQAAIDIAINGDTVELPAPCSSTWSSTVTIIGKGITLDGKGAIIAGSGVSFWPIAAAGVRVTNFTFTCNCTVLGTGGSSLSAARWRVDHTTFSGNGSAGGVLIDLDVPPGVFDHNTFAPMSGAQEFAHIVGYHAGVTTGWTNAHVPGSDEAIYFEDNTFTTNPGDPNNAWLQAYYGARTVVRYNTFNHTAFDNHGTTGMVGGRWYEIYNNTYTGIVGAPSNIRAGGGLVWGNKGVGTHYFCEEDSGYPALYQVGRGQNQVLFPVYTFLNQQSVVLNACEAPAVPGMVAFNRDVYNDTTSANCTAGGSCTQGVGVGTTLPTSCATNTGFWNTTAGGNWDTTNQTTNDGALFKCTSANTWTLYYIPLQYPHPVVGQGTSTPGAPRNLRIVP